MIRLGQINFINCLPVNYPLTQYLSANPFPITVISSTPSDLNRKLYQGEIDIAPISSFEYLSHRDSYDLLEDISISSIKDADSVLFFSKYPLDELRNIHLSPKSASSAALLRIILSRKYGLKSLNFSTENPTPDTPKLLIGDEALLEDSSQYIKVLDIGREWYEFTGGLPTVFGLWASRKDSFIGQEFKTLIHQCKNQGLNELFPDVIIEAYKQTGLPKAKLQEYFKHLDYNLSEKHLESLYLFDKYLKEIYCGV
jgi:chorismate dehydratase